KRPAKVGSPTPATRIKLAHVATMAVNPAQVKWRKDADDHSDAIPVLDSQVVGTASAHRDAGEDMGLALCPDGIMLCHKGPNILHNKIFEPTRFRVNEEAAGRHQAGLAGQAAVGSCHDDLRKLAMDNGTIKRLDNILEK